MPPLGCMPRISRAAPRLSSSVRHTIAAPQNCSMADLRGVLQKTVVLASIGITLYYGSIMAVGSYDVYQRAEQRKKVCAADCVMSLNARPRRSVAQKQDINRIKIIPTWWLTLC